MNSEISSSLPEDTLFEKQQTLHTVNIDNVAYNNTDDE